MKTTIYPCLWMEKNINEAADYYTSIFKNAVILTSNPMSVTIQIDEMRFMLLNGGPQFAFSEAISFVLNCENQAEIDYYWDALSEEGSEGKCGWLKDKFGVSWQVVPQDLNELMNDSQTATQVVYELMKMNKIDIIKLNNA